MNKSDLEKGITKTEPRIRLPKGITPVGADTNEIRAKALFYMPIPNTTDAGIYVNKADLVALLRANKNSPKAIEYIADMME